MRSATAHCLEDPPRPVAARLGLWYPRPRIPCPRTAERRAGAGAGAGCPHRRWRDGGLGALRMGVEHGAYCVGCCWGLILVLFALGVMSLTWMAIVSVLIFAQKVLPRGELLTRIFCGRLRRCGYLGRSRPQHRPRAYPAELSRGRRSADAHAAQDAGRPDEAKSERKRHAHEAARYETVVLA